MSQKTKTQQIAGRIYDRLMGTIRLRKNVAIFAFGVGLWATLTAEPDVLSGVLILALSATLWGIAHSEQPEEDI
jgi:hypothetical protein